MEAENTSASWSSATNWTVADGSLATSVTFESSGSPIENSTVATRKSPLLLRPSSPDSGPCDIKISFAQKHEVRQVYIRSTARVYEIYYVPNNMQSSNEYLCTVRCGLAAKESSNHATEGEEGEDSNDSNKQLDEKSKSDSSISTCEDDWVEVKVPNSPLLDRTNSSLPSKSDTNSGRTQQDFYEATAEMTDADPCTSLILRMLSLQDKGCIYVDEVYVFADPVDSAESDDQQGRVENSAGSSLMAMLVPTLLQLSKAGKGQVQDKNTFDSRIEQKSQQIGSEGTAATNTYDKCHVEGKSNIANWEVQKVKVQEHILTQVPDIDSNPDSTAKEKDIPYSCLERAMDKLVSRVSRIEDICLRFEENMLRPICSIEARLQQVEQQLEILTMNSQCSGFPCGTRFSAPDFSCIESGSNSFYNDGNDYPSVGVSGSDKRDISFGKLSIPPDEMSAPVNGTQLVQGLVVTAPEISNVDSEEEIFGSGSDKRDISFGKLSIPADEMSAPVNGTQLVQGLVVTAPEFSNIDSEEEFFGSEPVIDSVREKPKEAVSIDDALASALAGFISSTSIHLQQYTQALSVKAPEFPNDEDGNDDIVTSPRIPCERAIDLSLSPDKPFVYPDIADVTECVEGSLLSPCSVASFENEHPAMKSLLNKDYIEDGTEEFDEGCQKNGGGEGHDDCHVLFPAKHKVEDTSDRQISKFVSEMPISDDIGIATHPPEISTDGSSNTTDEGSSQDTLHLQNVLEFRCPSPVLDFEAPILDVRFNNSDENSIAKSPLESLLGDKAESSVEDPPCVEKSDDGTGIGENCSLILVEDGEVIGTATDNDLFVDMFHYELEPLASNTGDEEIQSRNYSCCSHEIFATSLI